MEYTTKQSKIPSAPGTWNTLLIEIFEDENKIGEYTRNYSSFYNTFRPFEQNGEMFALYSRDYTATRVMSLPDCKDIAGEDRNEFGFCPVDFYVPYGKGFIGQFGFIAGCVWGDDSSWKVQLLDLRHIKEGKIKRHAFDYHALPNGVELKDAIKYASVYERDMEFEIASAPRDYCIEISTLDDEGTEVQNETTN